MAFNVTVTPQVQEVEVSATVQPYEVQVEVIDSPILDLTTNGTSGDATFDPFTGVLNIPNYTTDLSGVVPTSRTLTINGTAFDLSANRSWTVGDLLSSGSYADPSWITSLGWSKISGTPTSLSGYGILDPVVLTSGSYADPSWITSLGWNKIASNPTTLSGYGITDAYTTGQVDTLLSAKQNNITLTTTGTSGASTLVGATLNVPTYTLSGLGGINLNSSLTGFSVGANTSILATDSILTAFNKTQGQINARVSGSGASGQVAFWNGASSQTGSNNLFWNNTLNRLGIGNNVPGYSLDVTTGVNLVARFVGNYIAYQNTIGNLGTGNSIEFATNSNTPRLDFVVNGFYTGSYQASTTDVRFANNLNNTGTISFNTVVGGSGSTKLRIFNSGNLLLQNGGTFTDAGFRLDVNGTARIQGNLTTNITAGQVMFAGTSGLLSGSNNLFWDSVNGRLGIGTNVPLTALEIVGSSTNSSAKFGSTEIQSFGVNNNWVADNLYYNGNFRYRSNGLGVLFYFNAGAFAVRTAPSGTANNSAVTTTRFSIINTGDFAIGGSLASDLAFTGATLCGIGGNVQIGTSTNSGFRLDVNGTARVQGDFTISDTRNIILATTTGTKIGTATSQKLSLWNATPDVQPTTAITASAFVANSSGILDDTATFGGYTIGQIVAALKRLGALA